MGIFVLHIPICLLLLISNLLGEQSLFSHIVVLTLLLIGRRRRTRLQQHWQNDFQIPWVGWFFFLKIFLN